MTREQIKLGIKKCIEGNCATCPYREGKSCSKELKTDALNLILNLELELGKDLDCADAEPWTRQRVLAEAEKCVCGQREHDYGGPEDSFRLIAELWEPYIRERLVSKGADVSIEPHDVAVMMGLLKVARIASNPQHMDNWVDLAGYAACGGEIAGKEDDG